MSQIKEELMPEKRTALSVKNSTKEKLDAYLNEYEEKTGLRITNISFLDQAVSEKIERDSKDLKKAD